MFSRVFSAAVFGIDAYVVDVETDLDFKLPALTTVGLAEGAVKESKERVISAIKNSGYNFPQRKVTVNLAPADKRKEGSGFDLPIAVGILAADGKIPLEPIAEYIFIGELSLEGSLRAVKGILPIAMEAANSGFKGIILPEENAAEAALVENIEVYSAARLVDVINYFKGADTLKRHFSGDFSKTFSANNSSVDFADVKGQSHVKRALEVAASGGHNVLMIGPPGSGKTMMARRIPTILPDISREEALETTKIHSVAGILKNGIPLVTERPYRDPHYTISEAALVGGGIYPRPGEVSMAHNGVLFLDEFPELGKKHIEVLRQPLEDGVVTVSRANYNVSYPAVFMLVAAMNPCPCGYLTDPQHDCTCSVSAIQKYVSRVSGPIFDRIDIQIEVPSVRFKELLGKEDGEKSAEIKNRVDNARTIQHERFKNKKGIHSNSQLEPRYVESYCSLDSDGERIMKKAMDTFGFSARAFHRILKVARTIADIEKEKNVLSHHISEAIQYRTLDRKVWLK